MHFKNSHASPKVDRKLSRYYLDFNKIILDLFLVISYGNPVTYIVGCGGASQLGGSLLGIPLGYKANKL